METTQRSIALPLARGQHPAVISISLRERGVLFEEPRERVNFRICPGNHECKKGLSPTREVAALVVDEINKIYGERNHQLTWAISGCHNGCSQPQLAGFGIVTKKLIANNNGHKEPCFQLYRRDGEGLRRLIAHDLSLAELLQQVRQLVELASVFLSNQLSNIEIRFSVLLSKKALDFLAVQRLEKRPQLNSTPRVPVRA